MLFRATIQSNLCCAPVPANNDQHLQKPSFSHPDTLEQPQQQLSTAIAPPSIPPLTIDLLPAFQNILPQLTKAVVEALMPEFQSEVLRLIPILLNDVLANTLMHRIRNEIQRMILTIVVETLQKPVQLKRNDGDYDADTSTPDGDVAAEGDSKSSQQPKTPGAKYSDIRVSDEEILARFKEAKRKQAVIQTKDVTNAGVAVPVSFEQGGDGKYAGTQSGGAGDWMGKGV